ncbi:hypothetical protein ONS95_008091 [Cadophora gregata]|uniref:uncharacterized protein n=1 Tax=Cadophora gregata TaxID=51156 RepID=UPI0026DD9634|nr:uncharacterized protein ONS95_008091 [Cadophora gregata]KAK0119236.1 hypothetical protein ONS96_012297 [Cadophora gregata f. sp. sojae]KAK0126494.1 hypothetical protein ONS95_008091 [Cadophora gregata]
MRPSTATLAFTLLSIISSGLAQTTTATAAAGAASPDGVIVPFNSGLPVCASKCGPLFDVQGKCSPPATTAVDENCFCTDSRLTVFDNGGTTGVSLVCGPQSCTSQSDMEAVKKWYDGFCAKGKVVTTTASNGVIATQTGVSKPKTTGPSSPSWYVPHYRYFHMPEEHTLTCCSRISSHYKWVIMIVVIFFAIVGGWIGACLLRRRYLRKKEREIEMKPPVAWGPHQMQGATGGYNYGDAPGDGNRGGPHVAGGHSKEYASAAATPADGRKAKRESRGLHKLNRF